MPNENDKCPKEEWRPVAIEPYSRKYEVSSIGRVRNILNGKLISLHYLRKPDRRNYTTVRVGLSCDGQKRGFTVSNLVLGAFVGPRPDGFQACHGDCDPTNNSLSNLRWDTPKGNMADTMSRGRFQTKLNQQMVLEMRKLHGVLTERALAKMFNISKSNVHDVLSGRTWNYGPAASALLEKKGTKE